MRKIFYLFLLVILAVQTKTQAQLLQVRDFKIHKEGYLKLPFEKMKEGDVGKVAFTVYNVSDEPLIIESFETGCDCMIANKNYKKELQKGESTTFKIKYKSKGRVGTFSTFGTLTTNSKNYPSLWIKLEGVVRK